MWGSLSRAYGVKVAQDLDAKVDGLMHRAAG